MVVLLSCAAVGLIALSAGALCVRYGLAHGMWAQTLWRRLVLLWAGLMGLWVVALAFALAVRLF